MSQDNSAQDFDIRYSDLSDAELLLSGLACPKNRFHYPITEEDEVESFVKNWIGFSKFKASLTATVEEKAVGVGTLYLMPYRKIAHHALFYVFVEDLFRRRGIGSSLVKNLLHLAKTRFGLRSLHCEVFEGSSLLSILEKQQFLEFACQERYIKIDRRYYNRHLWEHFFDKS